AEPRDVSLMVRLGCLESGPPEKPSLVRLYSGRVPLRNGWVKYGCQSLEADLYAIIGYRLGCAETGPLRRGRREGELRTLPVIPLRRRISRPARTSPAGVPPGKPMHFRRSGPRFARAVAIAKRSFSRDALKTHQKKISRRRQTQWLGSFL